MIQVTLSARLKPAWAVLRLCSMMKLVPGEYDMLALLGVPAHLRKML